MQVTEFCTYGSLFDFLHSMDWMVTDERLSGLSGLSGTTQSWMQERASQHGHPSLATSTTGGGSVGRAAVDSSAGQENAAAVELQGSVGSNPLNLNVAPPQTTGALTWHDFTQLSTPPPSPAPSPAIAHSNVNHKRIGGPGLVSQMFNRQSGLPRGASNASNNGNGADADLEKGENELSGINTSGSSSSANNKISGSLGKSDSDLASRLADALSSHYDPGAGGPKSDNGRGSWSNSFRTVRLHCPSTSLVAMFLQRFFDFSFYPLIFFCASFPVLQNPSNDLIDRNRLGSIASRTTVTGAGKRGAAEPQLQSATSILLTRELGYGMGPKPRNTHSYNYTMKSIRLAAFRAWSLSPCAHVFTPHTFSANLLKCTLSSSILSLQRCAQQHQRAGQ